MALMILFKKRPKKSVMPPSGNIKKRKYSRQKARRTQCSYYILDMGLIIWTLLPQARNR
jgi:hypothetical protein